MEKFDYEISKKEFAFIEAFNNAIEAIQIYERSDDPLTLREVLTMGFNNVILDDSMGWTEDDFDKEQLNTHVGFDIWEEDADGYRNVYLTNLDEE